uniref:Uncharacterized protein n=2 Tax=Meloidogyne TaxID=189290 RepID=A0A915PBR3_9BILA
MVNFCTTSSPSKQQVLEQQQQQSTIVTSTCIPSLLSLPPPQLMITSGNLIKNLKKISIKMSAEESTSLNIKNNSTNFDNLQKNSEQPTNKKRKRCGPNLNKQQRLKKKMAKMANSSNEPPLDPQIALVSQV